MWTFESATTPASWSAVDSPVSVTLHAVVQTANGPCAVGNGGSVVGRARDGTWGVVVDAGIAAKNRAIYDVAPTDDGTRLWLVGASGTVGYYDLAAGERRDLSATLESDSALQSVAVSGPRGGEKLLAADANGNVFPADVDGDDPQWGPPTRPAAGTVLTDLAADDAGIGYGVDTSANVWVTTADDGWERVGIDGEGNSLYAVTTTGDGLLVGGGSGRLHASDESFRWTPFSVGQATVYGLDGDADRMVAGGGSGEVHVRESGGDWRPAEWSGSATIYGVCLGEPAVAVGASGTILEGSGDEKSGDGSDGATDGSA
jgi:hypothetical protein